MNYPSNTNVTRTSNDPTTHSNEKDLSFHHSFSGILLDALLNQQQQQQQQQQQRKEHQVIRSMSTSKLDVLNYSDRSKDAITSYTSSNFEFGLPNERLLYRNNVNGVVGNGKRSDDDDDMRISTWMNSASESKDKDRIGGFYSNNMLGNNHFRNSNDSFGCISDLLSGENLGTLSTSESLRGLSGIISSENVLNGSSMSQNRNASFSDFGNTTTTTTTTLLQQRGNAGNNWRSAAMTNELLQRYENNPNFNNLEPMSRLCDLLARDAGRNVAYEGRPPHATDYTSLLQQHNHCNSSNRYGLNSNLIGNDMVQSFMTDQRKSDTQDFSDTNIQPTSNSIRFHNSLPSNLTDHELIQAFHRTVSQTSSSESFYALAAANNKRSASASFKAPFVEPATKKSRHVGMINNDFSNHPISYSGQGSSRTDVESSSAVDHTYFDFSTVSESSITPVQPIVGQEIKSVLRGEELSAKNGLVILYKPLRKNVILFPIKLLNMLSSPLASEAVKWLPHGRSFVVLDNKKLASVLPIFFKTNEIKSFFRQLNLWEFKRITHGCDSGSYYHSLFLRNRNNLATRMYLNKSKPGSGKRLPSNPADEPDFQKISELRPL